LSSLSFELRLVESSDEPFLFQLYASTHGLQFAVLPLAPAQRDGLVRMQFNAQRTGYRAQFPSSEDFIVTLAGEPAGRLWLDESGAAVRVVDIAIAPAHQGRGLGRAILERVIVQACESGKPVSLTVARTNTRAFELYRRLGFEVCAEDQMYVELSRRC
jgi:ribosomal protein S18 acetylase RimI-like enzyme